MTKFSEKWFYSGEDKISDFLKEKFEADTYRCNQQDVCDQVVYENWTGRIKGTEETGSVQFVLRKGSANEYCPQLIQVYWNKTEDTMQYFLEKKTEDELA